MAKPDQQKQRKRESRKVSPSPNQEGKASNAGISPQKRLAQSSRRWSGKACKLFPSSRKQLSQWSAIKSLSRFYAANYATSGMRSMCYYYFLLRIRVVATIVVKVVICEGRATEFFSLELFRLFNFTRELQPIWVLTLLIQWLAQACYAAVFAKSRVQVIHSWHIF